MSVSTRRLVAIINFNNKYAFIGFYNKDYKMNFALGTQFGYGTLDSGLNPPPLAASLQLKIVFSEFNFSMTVSVTAL